MYPLLIETIKCANGQCCNLAFHQSRFNFSRKQLFPKSANISLNSEIKVPEFAQTGIFRCRVLYSSTIEKIEFLPYKKRTITSLKLVADNTIDYRYKYADRKMLETLFEHRGSCDDILVVKNDCISDSFTANPVFWDGQNWWTPDTPLLPGTQRAKLLDEQKIKVCRISVNDLAKYQKVGLINAMQDLEHMPVLDIQQIVA